MAAAGTAKERTHSNNLCREHRGTPVESKVFLSQFDVAHVLMMKSVDITSILVLAYTPYSKMAVSKLFFCLHVHKPSLPLFHFKILLFFIHVGEAKRAN